ncbi:MAG: hypothetical protein HY958_10580 [Bacteroidia bacterium]|nr:hypothetical protein [Bacteroidia bacterium]
MTKFLSKGGHKKDAKEIMGEISGFWKTSPKNERIKIASTLTALQLKRAIAYPHIRDYLLIMILFKSKNFDAENFKEWEKILNNTLESKKTTLKQIEILLGTTYNLLSEKVVYRYPMYETKNAIIEWKVNNPSFKFRYDKNVLFKIIFEDINLICFSKNSSSVIYRTSGIYYPFDREYKWEGVNGQVTWERAGFDKDEMFANLRRYTIDLSKSEYEADSVAYVYKKYFDQPLLGKIHEKIMADVTTPDKSSFPKFNSYTKRFKIPKIYEGIDFEGGFSMQGSKFIGYGSREEPAILYIYKKDSVFLTVRSKSLVFKKDLCTGMNTEISFKLDKDSIYHPSLTFKYFADKKKVELIRDGEGLSKCPFVDTYHKMDMEIEAITWKTDEPWMDLRMTRSLSGTYSAGFQSSNLFDIYIWDRLQYNDQVHPLVVLKKFAEKVNSTEFNAVDFANDYGYSISQVTQMLMELAFLNIISFDFETKNVKLNNRLYNYVSARGKKIDYDVIKITSNVSHQENAKLNLLNYDMRIYGVNQVQLSDSQNVTVFPTPNEILLKKNRSFEFDGRIRAGRFQFYGKTFSFDYDNFKINLTNCDSLHILATAEGKFDDYGKQLYVVIRSTVENIRGNLQIDSPNNKSGNKSLPQYPTFNSEKESYVYYDKKGIQGGCYKRDKFYFQIFPYSIDSLDNFENKNLRFKGHFASAGILPEFDETLALQPDYSLGFTRKSPPGGYQLYGGKATLNNDINLSNRGLRGDGDLNYLTSTTVSKDFIFFPDSMNTVADEFKNTKQPGPPEVPEVSGKGTYVHYMPYQDQLFATNGSAPTNMYEKQAYMHGTLKLEPSGLTGWGKMDIESAKLTSKLFYFKENIIDSDTAAFELKSMDMGDLAFKTDNVNAHVDFTKRMGAFKSNGEASFVEFPKNQYICFMDQINWYMDKSVIEMSIEERKTQQKEKINDDLSPTQQEDVQIEGPKFISVHPDQDSLEFVSPKAKYSLVKSTITAQDVRWIRVADATVYPSDKPVVIERRALMRPIEDAKIKANNTTRYHTLYNATVNIHGRKKYSAVGDYDYIDETQKKQKIHFTEITVDTTIQTNAKGKILEPDDFMLSPNYQYQGEVFLTASKENLTFTGSAKIKHECEKMGTNWFQFSSEINPNEIYIPISNDITSINNEKLTASVMIPVKADSIALYTAFLTKPRSTSDLPVVSANGFLYYDKDDNKYKISNKEKLTEFNMPGNYLHIHRTICNIYGEGKMDFGADFGQLKTEPIGNISQDYEKGETKMDIVMTLKFYFNESSIKRMGEMIAEAQNLNGVNMSRKTYIKALRELIGVEKADKWISQVALGNLKKYPDELEELILLSDVKMKWNGATHSYRSDGKIGIGSIYKKQVNKYVDGYIEIEKKRSGDIFTMYFQVDESTWFFFNYRAGQMLGLSSDRDFNMAITETKKDKLNLEVKKGEVPYKYYVATEGQKKKFLRRFEEGAGVTKEDDDDEEGGKKKKKKKEEDE